MKRNSHSKPGKGNEEDDPLCYTVAFPESLRERKCVLLYKCFREHAWCLFVCMCGCVYVNVCAHVHTHVCVCQWLGTAVIRFIRKWRTIEHHGLPRDTSVTCDPIRYFIIHLYTHHKHSLILQYFILYAITIH